MSDRRVRETIDGDPYLLGDRVVDGAHKAADLVAHGFGSDTGGGGLEVHLALTPQASRVTTWHERVHATDGGQWEDTVAVRDGGQTLC